MPNAHCIDCAEGTGSWCAGATALYEAAVEPAETICVGHTLEEWKAAVAAVLAKHDDPADVLFVPFWIRSDWMQSLAAPLKNGSTAVLVGGAANGVMMYPELDYGPAPPANHSYDARLFMAREFCRITESEDKRHVVMTTVALHERSKAFADGVAAFCGDRGHVLYAFDHSGDPSILNESMVYPPADIWHPSLSFVGAYDVAELRSTPCEVSCDGTVRWTRTFRVSSICDSALEMFPFDDHQCELRIHADVPVSQLELDVDEMHPFIFKFDHKPFAYYIKLVFPVALLNFAGFLGFWMDSASDSVALGITTVLCTLALRETVEFPDAFYLTWIEIFVMINITVQTICLVLAIFKYHKKTEYLIGKNMYSHPLARMKSVISASLGNERNAARASWSRARRGGPPRPRRAADSDDDEKDEGGAVHELVAVDVADEAPPSPSRSSRGGSPPLPDEAPATLSAHAPSTRKMLGSLTHSASMRLLGTPPEDDGELEVYHDYPTDLVGRYIVIPSYILIFFIFTYNEGELVKSILET
ncbi:GABA-A receptor [Aureococcus anophagefferens]|nr:GABA-A receptor [Aureococcus anophagefferens]